MKKAHKSRRSLICTTKNDLVRGRDVPIDKSPLFTLLED